MEQTQLAGGGETMSGSGFDLEDFRKHASARSEPRDQIAASRASYRVEIMRVWFENDTATIYMREQGKDRGVDVFLRIDYAGLQILLKGYAEHFISEAKKFRSRAEESEQKARSFESALNNLAEQALELKENMNISDEKLPSIFVDQHSTWDLVESALKFSKDN